ncbi:MAG: hypothetical protein SFY68_15025 [Candidatus Sumerlaeia bacterium]|nr:hypothetical protein [Candidatus Sumerlaeia bacterium]
MISLKRFWFVPLILLPMAYWWPLLFGYLPDFMDTVALQYPLKMAAARQLWEGTLPVWLPNQMAGMPLLAHPETGVLYPLNIPFFLFPGPLMYGWVIILHYILAGVGFYLLCRTYGCSRLSCLFGAVGFQFGSYFVSHIALLPQLFAMTWFPWILLCMEWDVSLGKIKRYISRGSLGVSLLYSLHLLAGAPQFAYYASFAFVVYWLGRWYQSHGYHRIGWMIARAILAVILAIGLAGGQLVPTLEFLIQSERQGGVSLGDLQSQSLNGRFIWASFIGGTIKGGEDTDSINAIGGGLLLLLSLVFLRKKNMNLALLLLGMGCIGFLFSLSVFTEFWYHLLPMFSSFRAPRRALVLWSMGAPLAATIGAHVLGILIRYYRLSRVMPIFYVLLLVPTALLLPRLERSFTSSERLEVSAETKELLRSINGRYVSYDPSNLYAHGSRRIDFQDSLLPNLGALNNLHDLQGYSPLILRRFGLARNAVDQQVLVMYSTHATLFSDPQARVLDFVNADFIVGDLHRYNPNSVDPKLKALPVNIGHVLKYSQMIGGTAEWPIRQWRIPKLDAWFVHSPKTFETPQEALKEGLRFPPGKGPLTLDLETPPKRIPPKTFTSHPQITSARWVNARTYRIEWNAPVQGEGLAVVAPNSWAKGWKASFDDDSMESCFPAYGFLTAAWVPPGTTSVDFVYGPTSFTIGMILSGWSVCIWMLGLYLIRKRERTIGDE